ILRFRNFGPTVLAKIQTGTEGDAIAQIEKLYKSYFPDENFGYRFLDEDYQALYQTESRVALLTTYASGLAVLISCLGLLGLAVFSAERRVKEIGIRKVLGASAWSIVHLLSRDFTKIVLVGIGLAIPLSYLIAREWLSSFAYKIDLQWWLFAGVAGLTLLVAWLTMSWKTLQAARANPITALKSE
ncbi:MAG: FtsX-like permease family protein, partial [Sinomicrobium sp.]|nr:FtsX-like permease family protein [Sinomicrobium sp.]